jgi:L-seryl-tRNA(Ser) seleniumtransferase
MENKTKEKMLRLLPSVDEVLRTGRVAELLFIYPRKLVVDTVRRILARERRNILTQSGLEANQENNKTFFLDLIVNKALNAVPRSARPQLRRVINATGVVLHTNLGRALLSEHARQAVNEVTAYYSNLELNLDTGKRGSRYDPLEPLLVELTGAEAALVVNNNAAAVLLALSTTAGGREIIVSRGQLVEIGGSFRIPEVMLQSGARLVEVGTTNKTYPEDYLKAVNENTALLLHVHTSNYRIIGFTRETTVPELVEIGRKLSLPVMSDLGSGSLVNLSTYGLPREPAVQEVVKSGADIVTFSGDKLLGGTQAGIIVGKRHHIEKMKKNPLTRALRINKMTVAALEATLREYLDEEQALREIPTLDMLTLSSTALQQKAAALTAILTDILNQAEVYVENGNSAVGGGAMPDAVLPTAVVAIIPRKITAGDLHTALRQGEPAVLARVQEEKVLFDVRTINRVEFQPLAEVLAQLLK